eukprot:g7636.t2
MEWIHWVEDGLYFKDIQHEQRRQNYDSLSSRETTGRSILVGLTRATNMEQGHRTSAIVRPSAEARGLLQRRRRRLRAWCSKAWETFRPRTNADLPSPPKGPPAQELIFLRKSRSSFTERVSWPTTPNDDHDEKPLCQGVGVDVERDAQHDIPATHGSDGCLAATSAKDQGPKATRDSSSHPCAAVERPLLVPCLRSHATSSAPVAAERPTTTSIESAATHLQGEQSRGHFNVGRSDSPATTSVEAPTVRHKSGAEKAEGRVSTTIEASVRTGDWVLPSRDGVPLAVGSRRQKGWLRVEAVSVGEECIILATRGTGGTRVPELRSSLRLLEISPASLTGALVVRLSAPPGGNGAKHVEKRASTEDLEGGHTQAFRLPVLCARWGLGLLRQWAADDSVFKALESPTPREEDARKRFGRGSQVHVNQATLLSRPAHRTSCNKQSTQAPSRRKTGHDAEEDVTTAAASTEDFGKGGCLRLSASAGESTLSLAWTNPRNDQISIHLFTPGGNSLNSQRGTGSSSWTELYRGRGEKFDVEGLRPCRRYFFKARLSALVIAKRRVMWRHAAFCTLPNRPRPPIAMRWTSGVPVAGVRCNNAKSTDKFHRAPTNKFSDLKRPAASGSGSGGRWKNLWLKMTGGDNPGRRDGVRSTPNGAAQKQLLGEDCSTWILEYRPLRRFRGDQLWGSGTRTALEWAGEPQAATAVVGAGSSSSTQAGNDSDGDGGDGDIGWERAYRGKRSECVIGSLAEGIPYAFRCARENADGKVGPWSEDLQCVVPCLPGKGAGGTDDGDGNIGVNGHGAAAAAPPAKKKSRFAAVPPPSAAQPGAGASVQGSYLESARGRSAKMKGYFDDSDEEGDTSASGSAAGPSAGAATEEEVDPLDAFMAGVQQTVKVESANIGKAAPKPDFLDEEAEQGDGRLKEEGEAQSGESGDEEDEDDAWTGPVDKDGFPVGRTPDDKKKIEALPPVDHSQIEYEPFRKTFYEVHPDMAQLNAWEVKQLRNELQVSVEAGRQRNETGVPAPVKSFKHAGFDDLLLSEVVRQGFEAPTPIQAQALPVVMSGRDMIGVAQTGSGKTLAFIWPALVHLMDQREIVKGKEGPIVVVLAPTRELAGQIYQEANKFAKRYGCKVCAVYGGAGKWEMQKALKEGPEIVVATPGRMIEMIKLKATNMRRCTMMVLDEADRMFDMGFEYQMRSIVAQTRPDRQTLMFSATFKRRVQQLAGDILDDPVHVHIGGFNLTANEDIHQVVHVLAGDAVKWKWFSENIPAFVAKGKVLVFVSSKQGCEDLCTSLNKHTSLQAGAIHGDKDQTDREKILRAFKQGVMPVLVGTDVASRGLDIKNVNTVVNYDVAKNIETHIHRVGRTGRMGKDGMHPGTAYTLVTQKNASFAGDLAYHLESAKQAVPKELEALAKQGGGRRGGGGFGGGGGGGRGGIGAGRGRQGGGIGFVSGKGNGGGGGGGGGGGSSGNGGKFASAGPALTSAAAAAATRGAAPVQLPPALQKFAAGVVGGGGSGSGSGKGRVHNPIEDAYDTKAPWSPGSKPASQPGSPAGGAAVAATAGGAGPNVRRGLWGKVLPAAKPLPPPQFPPLPPSALQHQQRQQPPLPPAMQTQPPPQPPLPSPQPSAPTTQPPLPPGAPGTAAAPPPRARKSRWS